MQLWLEYSFFKLIASKYMPASMYVGSGSSADKLIELFPK